MSIPPLVCSTPPPPDQCEDDKDHEDFDISYNLSQEDDEDSTEYDYGNYTSYDLYQTKSESVENEKWNTNLGNISESKNEQTLKSEEILQGVNIRSKDELIEQNITTVEEAVIEDLNLIVSKDIVHSNDKEFEVDADVASEYSENHARIQDEDCTNISVQDENTDISVPNLLNNVSISNKNDFIDDKIEDIMAKDFEKAIIDTQEISEVSDLPDITNEIEDITSTNKIIKAVTESPKFEDQIAVTEDKNKSTTDDEFGDFEDFQFSSSSNCPHLSVNSENPWGNDCNEDAESCKFTANFDSTESVPTENKPNVISCDVKEIKTKIIDGSDDDFGDFDDFRSSDNIENIAEPDEVISTPDVNLWNLHSPENDLQIVDSINTVLTSIFIEELPEPNVELVGKLESFLSVTWGHLIDIDVRQPYIVNWNNSLGQKTLLKALCIDSRNILFGPKWNYNMPKYAVNLCAAPLQPQKQFNQSTSINNESSEKVPNKEAGVWVDPFTPDGQESCNTEKDVPTQPAKRPTDLDMFESETSTKLSKIYSSTINVQPLRHINLPDTHIFTPTDSETPRSKTIHYDSGSSSLIPQPLEEINKSQSDTLPSELEDTVDQEYWDFQDFKGTNSTIPPPINTISQPINETVASSMPENVVAKANITYETQILQPIKLDPIIPTLNWPDPGEVKETFDDFSDFISNTSWNNDKENLETVACNAQKVNYQNPKIETIEGVDDEFETFQSAPVSNSTLDFSLGTTGGSQMSVQENFTSDNTPSKVESNNSKMFNNVNLKNKSSSISNNVGDMQNFNFPQTSSGTQSINTDILQPTSASSSGLNRPQHKSDQILQPLSLESYSQINWPNPGIDLQDLSRFNPINSLHSLKSETSGNSKSVSPAHSVNVVSNQTSDDDIWGDFVSSAPKQQPTPKKTQTFADDDEWTEFVSSPSMKPQNGLNTISFNVHTNLSMQKSSSQNKFGTRNNQIPLDIPTLNYITPKSSNRGIYAEKHFQNL